MKIARANSLKRLLITARSDTRRQEGQERERRTERQLPLARGERAEEPRGEARRAPILQLALFPAHAIRHRRVNRWMGVLRCVHRVKSISEKDQESERAKEREEGTLATSLSLFLPFF